MLDSLRVPLACLACAAGSLHAQTIHDLGVVAGLTQSRGADINFDGTVAVGHATDATDSNMRAIRWTLSGGTTNLGTISGYAKSYARGVSDNGQIVAVGLIAPNGDRHAARWTTSTPLTGLFSPVNAFVFNVNGISGDGSTIVGDLGFHAAKWTLAGGLVNLGTIGPTSVIAHATAANLDGSRVAGWGWKTNSTVDGVYGARWIGPTVTSIGPYFGNNTYLFAINPAGNVMAGVYQAPSVVGAPPQAFRRYDIPPTSFGIDVMPTLPGRTGNTAYGLSADGRAAVGSATGGSFPNVSNGFLWSTSMGTVDLNGFLPNNGINLTGWHILDAFAISGDGTAIVGTGIYNGQVRGYVARGINCLQKPTILEASGPLALCPGATASFSVAAGGSNTTTFTYNWRRNGILIPDGPNVYGSTFTGTQSPNFSIIGVSNNDVAVYDCVVGNACGIATSTPVNLTMLASGPPVVFSLPAPVYVCTNSSASFNVGSFNATTYNWEIYLPSSGWTLVGNGFFVDFFSGWSCVITGANTDTITFNGINMASLTDIPVRCGLANACYSLFPTEPSHIYIDTPPSINAVFPDKTECYPTPTTITVYPSLTHPNTYQWQKYHPYLNVWYNVANGTQTELISNFSNVYSNAQGPQLSYTVLDVASHPFNAQYRCVVTNGCGTTIAPVFTHTWDCPYTCPADFDASGGTPDNSDVNAFWAAWLNGDLCADVDCSGGVPDAADVQFFYDLWLAGGCDVPCPDCP
jgi:uncharacterized membrane protein